MDALERFFAYAGDFEKTYSDDRWQRLHQYFHDDATYEVKAKAIPCLLRGPEAIFAGIKKSLDGFDRKFESRELALVGDPEVEANTVSANWTVTYRKGDFAPYILAGQSVATYRDDKIAALSDSIEPAAEAVLADWVRVTGFNVDPSYT